MQDRELKMIERIAEHHATYGFPVEIVNA